MIPLKPFSWNNEFKVQLRVSLVTAIISFASIVILISFESNLGTQLDIIGICN